MAFNIFAAKRVSCFGQYDRIDDLITCKLRREKRSVHRQFLVDEFHFSAVWKCFDPLFVWNFGTSSVRGQCLSQVYVVRWEKLRSGMMSTLRTAPPNFLARLSVDPLVFISLFNLGNGAQARATIRIVWLVAPFAVIIRCIPSGGLQSARGTARSGRGVRSARPVQSES
jgi:hypothetical protein